MVEEHAYKAAPFDRTGARVGRAHEGRHWPQDGKKPADSGGQVPFLGRFQVLSAPDIIRLSLPFNNARKAAPCSAPHHGLSFLSIKVYPALSSPCTFKPTHQIDERRGPILKDPVLEARYVVAHMCAQVNLDRDLLR